MKKSLGKNSLIGLIITIEQMKINELGDPYKI